MVTVLSKFEHNHHILSFSNHFISFFSVGTILFAIKLYQRRYNLDGDTGSISSSHLPDLPHVVTAEIEIVSSEAEMIMAEAEIIMAEAEIIPLPPPPLPAYDGPIDNNKKSVIEINSIDPPFRNRVVVVDGQTFRPT